MSSIPQALRRFRSAQRELIAAAQELSATLEHVAQPHTPAAPREVRLIQEIVARRYQIPVELVVGVSREAHTTTARHIAMRLCRELTAYSPKMIALSFNRSEGGVEHGLHVVSARLHNESPHFPAELEALRSEAKAALKALTAAA